VKIKSFQPALRIFVGVTLVALAAGCASTGVERAEKTSASMMGFRNDVVTITHSTDATLTALSKVVETANADPRKAFNQFTSSLAKLDRAVSMAKIRAQEMKSQGESYFKQWEAEMKAIQDPEIRKLAETRKVKLKEIFAKLTPLMQQTKADFEPFSSSVHDLEKYLSNDTTIGGIAAARVLIGKTLAQGRIVQNDLDEVIAEMNVVAATITLSKVK
jgi:hypothetical protein